MSAKVTGKEPADRAGKRGWRCPTCGRLFGHRDQPHACRPSNVREAMDALRSELHPIVERVLAIVEDLPQVVIEHASGSFMAKAPSTFASFRPRARDVQVSFILDAEVDVFPINKTLRLSTNRVVHRMHVDALDDLDAQLVQWLQQAHALCTARTRKARPGRT